MIPEEIKIKGKTINPENLKFIVKRVLSFKVNKYAKKFIDLPVKCLQIKDCKIKNMVEGDCFNILDFIDGDSFLESVKFVDFINCDITDMGIINSNPNIVIRFVNCRISNLYTNAYMDFDKDSISNSVFENLIFESCTFLDNVRLKSITVSNSLLVNHSCSDSSISIHDSTINNLSLGKSNIYSVDIADNTIDRICFYNMNILDPKARINCDWDSILIQDSNGIANKVINNSDMFMVSLVRDSIKLYFYYFPSVDKLFANFSLHGWAIDPNNMDNNPFRKYNVTLDEFSKKVATDSCISKNKKTVEQYHALVDYFTMLKSIYSDD